MSEFQREDMIALFESMDQNSDGKVTIQELKQGIIANFCPDITDQEVAAMFVDFDDDGDKCISKAEFLEEMCDKVSRKVAFKQAFDAMDQDRNGSLSVNELKGILTNQGFDDETITEMFNQVDENHDGKISCEEFLKLV